MSINIIIPIYNVEKYIEECVNSVVNQQNIDFEIIAIDDGSTDLSLSIVQKMAEFEPRIKVFSYENAGLSVARNRGIKHCTKQYAIFLDSDDRLHSGVLSNVYDEINELNVDCLFYGSSIFYDEDYFGKRIQYSYNRPKELVGKVLNGHEIFNQFLTLNKYNVSACMYIVNTELFINNAFLKDIYHEDNLFTTKMLLLGSDKKFTCTNQELYQRRVRNESIMTLEKNIKHVQGYLAVFDAIQHEIIHSQSGKLRGDLKRFSLDVLSKANKSIFSIEGEYYPWYKKYRIEILKRFNKGYKLHDNIKHTLTIHFPIILIIKHKIKILNYN